MRNYEIMNANNLGEIWKHVLSKRSSHPVLLISDVDGTLEESSTKLIEAVESLQGSNISFMIATGRSYFERAFSQKFKDSRSLASVSPLIIAQGGSVVHQELGNGEEKFFVTPLNFDINEFIDVLCKGLDISRVEMFRGEYLCIHSFDTENVKEIIGIPVSIEDEAEVKELLKKYDGNIVAAAKSGELVTYSLAIKEYLERGMPEEAIGVLYESELANLILTELTIVGAELKKAKELLFTEFGLEVRIQEQIRDRHTGTRGCEADIHPSISDIVSVGKKSHIDAMMQVVKELNGLTIGFGDQGNDDFLYSTEYSFVADAAENFNLAKGGWSFATEMAKRAKEDDLKVIHAQHGPNGTFINWAVEEIIARGTIDAIRAYCNEVESSTSNREKRDILFAQKA